VTQKPPPKKAPEKPAAAIAASAPAVKKPPLGQPEAPMQKTAAPARAAGGARPPPKFDQIEDGVLDLFKDTSTEIPNVFRDFLDKLEPPLALGGTSAALLKDFANIDVTAERVAQTLRSNQYYQHHFQRVVASMSRRPDPPPLEAAVVMLGMQNSRNLILALQMQRAVHQNHPEYDKDGKLKLATKEVLKYALKTEEIHVTLKAQYADLGFAAGLVFDYMIALAHKFAAEPKKVIPFIDHLYMHCLKSAYVARELSLQMPAAGFGKFTFPAALLHDIGKAAMAILTIEYFTFVEDCQKKDVSRSIRLFVEEERFGINHAVLGAMICNSFQIFRPIERVVLHHHAPFVIRETHRNLHPLTALTCLATNVANHFKKVDKDDDPVIKLWKGPEIADFAVSTRQILTAIQRVV